MGESRRSSEEGLAESAISRADAAIQMISDSEAGRGMPSIFVHLVDGKFSADARRALSSRPPFLSGHSPIFRPKSTSGALNAYSRREASCVSIFAKGCYRSKFAERQDERFQARLSLMQVLLLPPSVGR